MKIRMNDPCPCGSGKKYKKCCWNKQFDENRNMQTLDKLYAPIKHLNDKLLKMANAKDYKGATFMAAMELTLTSNALSLIKGVIQKNYISVTNALNARNIIESVVLIKMFAEGDISPEQEQLFLEQYKLIEYISYTTDGEGKYGNFAETDKINARYAQAKKAFMAYGVPENKIKRIANTRIPFLCDPDFNYNDLIQKYCPEFSDAYIELSQMVHPSSYCFKRNYDFYRDIVSLIMVFLQNVYGNRDTGGVLPYGLDEMMCYGFGFNEAEQLYKLQKAQSDELLKLSDDVTELFGEGNYISGFIRELVLVNHDINTDSHLGYTENVKLKFRVFAEMTACYNRVYFGFREGREMNYYGDASKEHERFVLYKKIGEPAPQKNVDALYESFKRNFQNSKLTKEKFIKSFEKPLGYLMDENGTSPSFTSLVKDYFDHLFKDKKMILTGKDEKEVKIKDYFAMCYKESNNMSHGCGYLFFANIGAWMDDINIIRFMDYSIYRFFAEAADAYRLYSAVDKRNEPFAERFKKSAEILHDIMGKKAELLKTRRIPKNF